jgi:hypothetical protein
MTISPNTDLGRGAETHLATITATGNFILFHVSHYKLGISDRNRDDLFSCPNLVSVCRNLDIYRYCRNSSERIALQMRFTRELNRLLNSELRLLLLLPSDLAPFVLFFQPSHQWFEVFHHRASGDVLAGGFLQDFAPVFRSTFF